MGRRDERQPHRRHAVRRRAGRDVLRLRDPGPEPSGLRPARPEHLAALHHGPVREPRRRHAAGREPLAGPRLRRDHWHGRDQLDEAGDHGRAARLRRVPEEPRPAPGLRRRQHDAVEPHRGAVPVAGLVPGPPRDRRHLDAAHHRPGGLPLERQPDGSGPPAAAGPRGGERARLGQRHLGRPARVRVQVRHPGPRRLAAALGERAPRGARAPRRRDRRPPCRRPRPPRARAGGDERRGGLHAEHEPAERREHDQLPIHAQLLAAGRRSRRDPRALRLRRDWEQRRLQARAGAAAARQPVRSGVVPVLHGHGDLRPALPRGPRLAPGRPRVQGRHHGPRPDPNGRRARRPGRGLLPLRLAGPEPRGGSPEPRQREQPLRAGYLLVIRRLLELGPRHLVRRANVHSGVRHPEGDDGGRHADSDDAPGRPDRARRPAVAGEQPGLLLQADTANGHARDAVHPGAHGVRVQGGLPAVRGGPRRAGLRRRPAGRPRRHAVALGRGGPQLPRRGSQRLHPDGPGHRQRLPAGGALPLPDQGLQPEGAAREQQGERVGHHVRRRGLAAVPRPAAVDVQEGHVPPDAGQHRGVHGGQLDVQTLEPGDLHPRAAQHDPRRGHGHPGPGAAALRVREHEPEEPHHGAARPGGARQRHRGHAAAAQVRRPAVAHLGRRRDRRRGAGGGRPGAHGHRVVGHQGAYRRAGLPDHDLRVQPDDHGRRDLGQQVGRGDLQQPRRLPGAPALQGPDHPRRLRHRGHPPLVGAEERGPGHGQQVLQRARARPAVVLRDAVPHQVRDHEAEHHGRPRRYRNASWLQVGGLRAGHQRRHVQVGAAAGLRAVLAVLDPGLHERRRGA
mmetsp:Transcript_75631/g.231473  ORF Transcript_75631/g.231473 Transcript_75631/m.231473 type:complete len:847 (-) Transcript_75631:589-3129(-)